MLDLTVIGMLKGVKQENMEIGSEEYDKYYEKMVEAWDFHSSLDIDSGQIIWGHLLQEGSIIYFIFQQSRNSTSKYKIS